MADPITPPNYTQIPNVILDAMGEMSGAEFKVVMAIARRTFGWHKERDKISLRQLMEITGLSKQGVVSAASAGVDAGFIGIEPDPHDSLGGNWYWLIVEVSAEDGQKNRPVKKLDRSKNLTETCQKIGQEPVKKFDQQKKGKKERKESPPPPVQDTPPEGGDGGDELTETEAYLLGEGFQPASARDFRHLDLEACRASIKKLRMGGTQNGGIVKLWRRMPPKPAEARASPAIQSLPSRTRPPDTVDPTELPKRLIALGAPWKRAQ